MQAVDVSSPGGPDKLSVAQADRPEVGPTQVLIKVFATAANRADTLQREGKYPAPPGASKTLGLECAGEIVEMGAECKRSDIQVGSRVMALLAGGGYAQYAVCDARHAMPVPEKFNWTQAACIPEVFLTAYLIARQLGGLHEGDAVLIHAGASGVGTALIQLCKRFGATAIVSVGSAAKEEACRSLGAAHSVNYKADKNWSASVKEFVKRTLNKDGVDLVLDCVGASHAAQNLEALGMDGRIILYGTMGGVEVDKFPLGIILRKRIRLQGSTLRARSEDFKAELVGNFTRECLGGFSDGTLTPILDKEFHGLEHMRDAHERMETNDSIGKIVVTVKHE